MKRNSLSAKSELPKLERSNLDEVFKLIIDGCNDHIEKIKACWSSCNASGSSNKEISDAYSALLENIFSLSEVIGFGTAIFYTCGVNIEEGLIRLESRPSNWPLPPKGEKHKDFDSIVERWIMLVDRIIHGSEHVGATDADGVCDKSDAAERAESWPRFKEAAKQAVSKICSETVATRINEIRPSYVKIKNLEKLQASSDKVPNSQKLSREDVATMFRSLCLLSHMVGFINGLSYAVSTADMKITFPVPNGAPMVWSFEDFKEQFEKLTSGAKYYERVSKAIISLIVAYKSKKVK